MQFDQVWWSIMCAFLYNGLKIKEHSVRGIGRLSSLGLSKNTFVQNHPTFSKITPVQNYPAPPYIFEKA